MSSESLRLFTNEFRHIQKTPKSEADRKRYPTSGYVPSRVERLYSGDTSQFEPIPENREHHLNVMMPMIISIANSTRIKFKNIASEDAIQSGMIGALIAIDRYYEREKTERQIAKLSTYAYPYIKKHVNEFCYSNSSILSSETTKWSVAASQNVRSGDERFGGDSDNSTLFEVCNSQSLHSYQQDVDTDKELNALKHKLFECLTNDERLAVCLSFGIGCKCQHGIREIVAVTGYSVGKVHALVSNAVFKLKKHTEKHKDLVKLIGLVSNNKQEWSIAELLQN